MLTGAGGRGGARAAAAPLHLRPSQCVTTVSQMMLHFITPATLNNDLRFPSFQILCANRSCARDGKCACYETPSLRYVLTRMTIYFFDQ
jgi:hypothetical protein